MLLVILDCALGISPVTSFSGVKDQSCIDLCKMVCSCMQAHLELDIKAKVQLLAGIVEDPQDVPLMIRKQPQILALSEVTIQVCSVAQAGSMHSGCCEQTRVCGVWFS